MNTVGSIFSIVSKLNKATATARLLRASVGQHIRYVGDSSNELYIGVSVDYDKDSGLLHVRRNGEQMFVSPLSIQPADSPVFRISIFVNERSKANAFSESLTPKQNVYKFVYNGESLLPLNRESQMKSVDLSVVDTAELDAAAQVLMNILRDNRELHDGRKTAPAGSIQAELNAIKAAKAAARKAAK